MNRHKYTDRQSDTTDTESVLQITEILASGDGDGNRPEIREEQIKFTCYIFIE